MEIYELRIASALHAIHHFALCVLSDPPDDGIRDLWWRIPVFSFVRAPGLYIIAGVNYCFR